MARRKRSWQDPKPKTVFGSASDSIKGAIHVLANRAVGRFLLEPVPTSEVIKMLVRPGDLETLRKAEKLTHMQQRGGAEMMLKVDSSKGDWADVSRVRFSIVSNDPDRVMVPDYCYPSFWEAALGSEFAAGNVQPGASCQYMTALEHNMKDLLEIAHDWTLVETLFGYLDSKPEVYKKSNVRFMWAGIMPLLRAGGEVCRNAAVALAKVSESGWCQTPPEIYPALKHCNEVIARGLLLGSDGEVNRPAASPGWALPKLMASEMWHPCWSLEKLKPRLI